MGRTWTFVGRLVAAMVAALLTTLASPVLQAQDTPANEPTPGGTSTDTDSQQVDSPGEVEVQPSDEATVIEDVGSDASAESTVPDAESTAAGSPSDTSEPAPATDPSDSADAPTEDPSETTPVVSPTPTTTPAAAATPTPAEAAQPPPVGDQQVTNTQLQLLTNLLVGRDNTPSKAEAKGGPRQTDETQSQALRSFVPGLPRWAQGNVPQSLGLFLLFLVLAAGVRKLRRALPRTGLLPTACLGVALLVRVGLVVSVLLLVAAILRPFAEGAYPWLLGAAALAVGWSLRDVLPDVAAAIALRLENRLRPGTWISSGSYEGVIERRALRALWVRDPYGDRLAIPNRQILATTLRIQDDSGAIHDVALRLPTQNISGAADAANTRRAILEAVLTSPYVAADAHPAIRRDGSDPELWRVRARLLHERYAIHFEGELLERAEAALAPANPPSARQSSRPPPTSAPPASDAG